MCTCVRLIGIRVLVCVTVGMYERERERMSVGGDHTRVKVHQHYVDCKYVYTMTIKLFELASFERL